MGCGCKTPDTEPISESATENINKKIVAFLTRKNKFSIIGIFIFLFLMPVTLLIAAPIIIKILFDKVVMGRHTNIVELITFVRNKKIKK